MAKVRTICHICGNMERTNTPPASCVKCGANIADKTLETAIRRGRCEYFPKKSLGYVGTLLLTDNRLIWVCGYEYDEYGAPFPRRTSFLAEIVTTPIMHMMRKHYEKKNIYVRLVDLSIGAEESVFGVGGNTFTVTTRDGAAYKLSALPREDWVAAIRKAVADARQKGRFPL